MPLSQRRHQPRFFSAGAGSLPMMIGLISGSGVESLAASGGAEASEADVAATGGEAVSPGVAEPSAGSVVLRPASVLRPTSAATGDTSASGTGEPVSGASPVIMNVSSTMPP